ncbi:hypothetical protein F0P96_10625 [Hymenobacter busanensis]|uniref:Uncharacterized protein n=1 Tax=Hymenobacter busanensis TaxID=2607656 RepID=A0A7L4ZYI1_9BACT|nr:hypothetical protein [Hymenobacter busanensis]KAA9333415.1 hypothetical protein F0P96_10625 [Hymenobacter busanensis]QHJ07905.1 hypothetical protein GUY19_11680 [Hymenobacter busanensis]
MAVNPDDPTIPVNCEDAVLPTGLAAADCYTPELNYGPIVNLYLTKTPFAAPPTLVEVTRRLALASTDDEQLVGPIVVQLSRAAATGNTIRVNGVDYDAATVSSYDVTMQDTSDANYDLARATQGGGIKRYVYGVDQNNNWFGGQNGITGGQSTIKLRVVLPTGETDLQTLTGTVSGLGKFDPKRIASPVAAVFG